MEIIPKEDWEENIRSDLWANMTPHQLNIQRDLISNKITTLYKMPTSDPTVQGLLAALNKANTYVNDLINYRQASDPRAKRNII